MRPYLFIFVALENFSKKILPAILLSFAFAYGLWYAWSIRWTCDDIYITLRYISNWFDGKGIVYNAGEQVEGYTHFLWLLMVAAAGKLGADMEQASVWLGLFSFAAVIFISAWRAKKIGLMFPVAAMYFCFHHDMAVWATGGLETMFYGLLMLAAFSIRFQSSFSYRNKLLLSGLVCALAVLTRPDAALLLFWFGGQELVFLFMNKTSFRQTIIKLFTLGIFPILLLTPWLIWKYNYYGDILPNTYYAKSGGLSYFSQGWIYLDSYARGYISVYVALLLGIIGIIVGLIKRKNTSSSIIEIPLHQQSLSVILFVALYAIVFVAKSGGDYMYARFIVPIVPLYMIPAENALLIIFRNVSLKKFVLANILIAFAWSAFAFVEHGFRDSLFYKASNGTLSEKWKAKIYESHVHHKYSYPSEKYRRIGEELNPVFAGTQARVLNFGDCCLCYYAGFDFVLENFGLTDSTIAHKPITERVTMVGHEKEADWDYLAQRNIQICINGPDFSHRPFTKFVFISSKGDSIKADMLRYDVNVMETAKKNGGEKIQFTNPYDWFQELIAEKDVLSADSLNKAYEQNRWYYFEPNRKYNKVKQQEAQILQIIK